MGGRRVIAGTDLPAPESVPFASGTAVVYTARSPSRDTGNEDACALLPLGNSAGVLAVADGAGGERGGAEASRTAMAALDRALEVSRAEGPPVESAILEAMESANRDLLSCASAGASTLVLVHVDGPRARPYHVGDSVALIVGQRGRVKHRTMAHSPVGYAEEAGLLDEREALGHEERHLVSNMMGDDGMRIEVGPALDLAPRDTVLLASDGLFDNLYADEIVQAVRKGPLIAAADSLVALCMRRMTARATSRPSKPDDLTFVLFRRRPPARRTS